MITILWYTFMPNLAICLTLLKYAIFWSRGPPTIFLGEGDSLLIMKEGSGCNRSIRFEVNLVSWMHCVRNFEIIRKSSPQLRNYEENFSSTSKLWGSVLLNFESFNITLNNIILTLILFNSLWEDEHLTQLEGASFSRIW